jgi:hypothetical protein
MAVMSELQFEKRVANGYAERLIATVLREGLDRMLAFGEAQLAANSFCLCGV